MKRTVYTIQIKEKGRWKLFGNVIGRKDASLAYDDAKKVWNRVRIKRGKKVLHEYTYKKLGEVI